MKNSNPNVRQYFTACRSLLILLLLPLTVLTLNSYAQPLRRHQPPGAYGKPNIILIVADTATLKDIEPFNKGIFKTPHLSLMAKQGIIFNNFYCADPYPARSLASLLTGLHPARNLLSTNTPYILNDSLPVLSLLLKNAGYRTGVIGVWELGDNSTYCAPTNKSFDQWFGYFSREDSRNLFPTHLWRNDKKWIVPGNQSDPKTDFAPDWFLKATTNFIRIYREYPFFLYLPAVIPAPDTNLPSSANKIIAPTTNPERAKRIALLDKQVGVILDFLSTAKIQTNTIVIFTSQPTIALNLTNLNSSDLANSFAPTLLSEVNIKVPTIIFWQYPGIKPGTIIEQQLAFWDILPTIAELADFKLQTPTDGCSIIPAILNKQTLKTNLHAFLFWQTDKPHPKLALRFENFKAIKSYTNNWQIFDINNDPFETNNLLNTNPALLSKTLEYLQKASNYFKLNR